MRVSDWARRKQASTPNGLEATDFPDRAWKVFDVVTTMIEHADIKAGVILGTCGVAAAAIIGLITNRSNGDVLLTSAAAASGIFTLMAATLSCGALWPRRLRNVPSESLLYFDHIVRRQPDSPQSFEDEMQALLADPTALGREIIKQIWLTSHVAAKKYNFIDRAMISLFGVFVTLIATAIIFVMD